MTGEGAMSPRPAQRTVQHRSAPSECVVGREQGIRCLPVVPGSIYCDNHHPDRRERRREITRRAAQASHARRPDPEVMAWADTLDFTADEARARGLTEVAQLVAREGLTPAQGNAIAALARAAAPQQRVAPKAKPAVVVEVVGNGHEARK